jgi:oligoendopeptidase F
MPPERRTCERAWRLATDRRQRDRDAIGELWRRLLETRHRQAIDAGFSDYRAYRWQQLGRADYTPDDCRRFHHAVEEWVTPVLVRLHEEQRVRLAFRRLQPWDLLADLDGPPPLRPLTCEDDVIDGVTRIMCRLDPAPKAQVESLVRAGLLDLRSGSDVAADGSRAAMARASCILPEAGGTGLAALFHGLGHVLQTRADPQHPAPPEFAEMAAMAIELLGMSSLDAGGFYQPAEAARAQRDHLVHGVLTRLPAVAMIDAFEHWAYTRVEEAADLSACGRQWRSLWLRFLPGIDWSGLDDALETEWQRHINFFLHPFATIACGPAQVGAIQVWALARRDPVDTLARFRDALALARTHPVPDLYTAAGACFALDEHTLREAVDALEEGLG